MVVIDCLSASSLLLLAIGRVCATDEAPAPADFEDALQFFDQLPIES
jgi:hypothetical protein